MPKKLKLDLNNLKVKSFVTSLDEESAARVKGGATAASCDSCAACSEADCETTPYDTCVSYYETECDCPTTCSTGTTSWQEIPTATIQPC